MRNIHEMKPMKNVTRLRYNLVPIWNKVISLVSLDVEINPQFYWGKIKTLVYENKTSYDIIVNGLATALLKYQGGFKQC